MGCGLAWGDQKMKNICFYISDYGYGHASRDIAIIRQILNAFTDVKIFVKSDGPFNFLRQSLPQESVQVIQTRNDVGVVFKENSVIEEAYKCADVALVLPFNEEMNIFKKKKAINLVSRKITMNRYDMRKKCGASDDELLAYVRVGKSLNPSFMRNMKPTEARDVKFLVSSNADLPFKNLIRIPNNETETQNYMACVI